MNTERLKELYVEYGLDKQDVFKHQHYVIITRSGIEKIQAKAGIEIRYEDRVLERDFAVIKAYATKGDITLETYGSALKGATHREGNSNSWYTAEMAEKRAFSRAVLKITGFYECGVFGEDEAEDFKRK
jgi:hypothetical protein